MQAIYKKLFSRLFMNKKSMAKLTKSLVKRGSYEYNNEKRGS